ncbi:LamG domain-containing protein [Robertkochia solimangrovi]|uniref:LamG domain-containing protein n=1 Tax=Robertkochia solimangrovi TaxID=2213046 RepID=UPI00117FE389|nr:LamG domain-containing protein [Robertkochia solimangrovi]TRZ43663.1 LamG domain-containing protein [Robertkochia solimangrovi]
MKTLKYIVSLFLILCLSGCDNGIDSITRVEPGDDETAPEITINYPNEGTSIQVLEAITTLNIDFRVEDDIELGTVTLTMDGSQLETWDNFKDYRIFLQEYLYQGLTDGQHTMTVTATDLDGKNSSSTVNFEKIPAYEPMFDGEIFYMAFDGNFFDLVNLRDADKVGTPGFANESYAGTNAYKGSQDSYLTYPTEGLLTTDEFSGTFWYKVSGDPTRAGIIVIGDDAEDRNQGFRLFREGDGANQQIKLNVGTGDGESWNDGGVLNVADGEWVHVAFTISQTESKIYFNGQEMLSSTLPAPIDWTGCETITIGSGGETFSYWDHFSDSSPMDDLRFFNKALSETEIQLVMGGGTDYEPEYDGEVFYMPFNGDNIDLASGISATEVGSPGFTDDGLSGSQAYAGATDSYLTFPAGNLTSDEFSASLWYKVDPDPTRAGILTMSQPDPDNPDAQNIRTSGFRLFREGSETEQIIKLNVGNGSGETWVDGGATATVDATAGEYIHIAFTMSQTTAILYINGEVVAQGSYAAVDWTGCDLLSIASGAPRFIEWDHLSDLSYIDDLRIFEKVLSQEEIQTIMNDE